MNLREQIAEVYNKISLRSVSRDYDFADAILALPSGLEAVKKCDCKCHNYSLNSCNLVIDGAMRKCKCGDTGEIVRDLTVGEAIEWAKELTQLIDDIVPHSMIPTLPSDERVRVKKC